MDSEKRLPFCGWGGCRGAISDSLRMAGKIANTKLSNFEEILCEKNYCFNYQFINDYEFDFGGFQQGNWESTFKS